MKKILLVFLVIFCLGIFFGCSYSYPTHINTSISSIYIIVTYNEGNLRDIGIESNDDLKLIRENIEKKAEEYTDQLLIKYKNIISNLYLNDILTSAESILYKKHLEFSNSWNGSTYKIEMNFFSHTASRIFIKYGGFTKGAIITDKLFTTQVKEEYEGLFTYLPNNLITTSVNNYFNDGILDVIINNLGGEIEESFSGVETNYVFLTDNSRMHSNGIVFNTPKGSIHYFVDNDKENIFIFYIVDANRYVWYLLALTITMIFLATYLIIIYSKKAKRIKIEDIIKK